MNVRISIGLVISLLVIAGFLVNMQPALAALPAYYGASWCGPCHALKGTVLSSGKTAGQTMEGLAKQGKMDIFQQQGNQWTKFNPETGAYDNIPGTPPGAPESLPTLNGVAGNNGPLATEGALNKIANSANAAAKAQQDECVFMAPGNVDEQFTPTSTGGARIKGSASGYGKYDPIDPTQDSPTNLALLKQGTTMETRFNEVSSQVQADQAKTPGKKTTIYLPNGAQAMEAAASGKYTVNGVPIKAGSKYVVGQTGTDGITMDENCDPVAGAAPKDPAASASDSGFGNGGANSPGSPGAGSPGGAPGGAMGGLGGLGALLPLLMQGLMGGGQGNQGNLGGQNGTGTGNTAIPCAAYGTSPVCGSDGKTYTNVCYMQQYGVSQVSAGVCSTASPTPNPAVDLNKLVSQLSTSGVPSSLVQQLQSIVAQILSSLKNGASIKQTTVS